MVALDKQVIKCEGQVPVDGRPVGWQRRLDHDRAVQPHLHRVVFPDVRVVPVDPGIGELERIAEGSTDEISRLGYISRTPSFYGSPIPAVRVRCRLDVNVIEHLHGDLRPLNGACAGLNQGSTHCRQTFRKVDAADGLGNGESCAQSKNIAIPKFHSVRRRRCRRPRWIRRNCAFAASTV